MNQLFINIKELIQVRREPISKISGLEMKDLPTITNAFLLIENGKISNFGSMENCPLLEGKELIDCSGKMILPTWCDSHTHIVYAGNREQEFVDRIKGKTYEEIANNGGGILNSAQKLNETSFDELYEQAAARLQKVMQLGTGAIEIKSGYGLTVEGEIKMLRVIKKLKENFDLPIKATFLGAHAVPKAFHKNKQAYIDLIINEMLPLINHENLADFIDVFCEKDYFTVHDTAQILKAAQTYHLVPKIHVNQFYSIGGIELCVKYNALSVDHLEVVTDEDMDALKNGNSIPVALPSCSFFLGIPYTPARKIIDNDIPLALASDYNPGSSPSGNMNFVVSTACIKMKMTPQEAINAATINGAYAMGLADEVGSISKNKKANFMITQEIPSYNYLPYSFGEHLIDSVYINGKKI